MGRQRGQFLACPAFTRHQDRRVGNREPPDQVDLVEERRGGKLRLSTDELMSGRVWSGEKGVVPDKVGRKPAAPTMAAMT